MKRAVVNNLAMCQAYRRFFRPADILGVWGGIQKATEPRDRENERGYIIPRLQLASFSFASPEC